MIQAYLKLAAIEILKVSFAEYDQTLEIDNYLIGTTINDFWLKDETRSISDIHYVGSHESVEIKVVNPRNNICFENVPTKLEVQLSICFNYQTSMLYADFSGIKITETELTEHELNIREVLKHIKMLRISRFN